MDFEDKQIFYVSSKDRASGTSSNFLYRFDASPDANYDSVVVLAASIPKAYYLISTGNDEFTLKEDNQTVNIQLNDGNYTLTAFKNTLASLLTTNSPNGWAYTITYPNSSTTNTGKLTFTVSGNGVIQPEFTFGEYLYEQMGFDQGTYTFENNTLVSANVVNLQLVSALFIHSDLCNNKHDSVLQEIYSNNSDFSNITYQATAATAYAKKIAAKNNTTYRFYLTNTYGDVIDLNGLNWNMTVMLYKENKTLEMIRSYIKLTLLSS